MTTEPKWRIATSHNGGVTWPEFKLADPNVMQWLDMATLGHVGSWKVVVRLERLAIVIPVNASLHWITVYMREDLIEP